LDGASDAALLAQSSSLDIPPLAERPLGLDEGPTLRVLEWRVEGVADNASGLLPGIKTLLNEHLSTQPEAGFTINQLQAIADEVTLYFRSRGLFLAQAFVPAQEVRNGIVALQVIEGALAKVEIEGNKLYDAEILQVPFADLVGRPIEENAIEQALLTLQDYPGLTVFGTFREGGGLGETELLVQVREEDRAVFRPMVDNYGSELTGEKRVGLTFDVNNLIGSADKLSGYVLQTLDPSNGTYGALDYSMKKGARARNTFGFGVAHNAFDVTDADAGVDLGLRGVVDQVNLRWQRNYQQRRTVRSGGTVGLAYQQATTEQPGDDPRDELLNLTYTYDYFRVGGERRGISLGFVRLVAGDNRGEHVSRRGSSGDSSGSFGKIEFEYQRLQRFGDHHALLMRIAGQQSNDLLASLEQQPLGGPANVRAYPVSYALADTGGAASLEWIVDAPGFAQRPFRNTTWGEVLQLSFYRDYAGGKVNDPLVFEQERQNLRGYGLGVQVTLRDKLALRLDLAKPDEPLEPGRGRESQTYLSVNMTF
jgi:hemolysin activation/secretion protein